VHENERRVISNVRSRDKGGKIPTLIGSWLQRLREVQDWVGRNYDCVESFFRSVIENVRVIGDLH